MPADRPGLRHVSRRATLAGLAGAPFVAAGLARASDRVTHDAWDGILSRNLRVGADGVARLPFAGVAARERRALDGYVDALAEVDVRRLERTEAIAFWVNLYNAATLALVVAHYPVRSIMDISVPNAAGGAALGPWAAPVVRQGGRRMSLDDIEKRELAGFGVDGRIHYALNCLSVGCPNLRHEAYRGAQLDRQLDDAARTFVNDRRAISSDSGRVRASSIYEWYADDFGGSVPAIVGHMRGYAAPALVTTLATVTSIDSYDYDWALVDLAA